MSSLPRTEDGSESATRSLGSDPNGLVESSLLRLPLGALRRHLAVARARRAIDDLRRALVLAGPAVAALSTVRGFSDAEFAGYAGIGGLSAAVRVAQHFMSTPEGERIVDLKAGPEPAELLRWLKEGDPI